MSKEPPLYEQNYTDEKRLLAEHIVGLERAALDKFYKGDTSGYAELWSKRSLTYFDAAVTERADNHETIMNFLGQIGFDDADQGEDHERQRDLH